MSRPEPYHGFYCTHDLHSALGGANSKAYPPLLRKRATELGHPPDVQAPFLPLFKRPCGYACFKGWSPEAFEQLLCKIQADKEESARMGNKPSSPKKRRGLDSPEIAALKAQLRDLQRKEAESRKEARLLEKQRREALGKFARRSERVLTVKHGQRGSLGRLILTSGWLTPMGARPGDRVLVRFSPEDRSLTITRLEQPQEGPGEDSEKG